MDISLLLEEKNSIQSKLDKTIEGIKQWFETKKENARTLFDSIKEKIEDKLSSVTGKITKDKKISKDVTLDMDGKKKLIAKKGESLDKVIVKLKTSLKAAMNSLKESCKSIILKCQRAIRKLLGIKDDRTTVIIQQEKKDVLDNIEQAERITLKAVKITSIIVSTISIAVMAKAAYKDRDRFVNSSLDAIDRTVDTVNGEIKRVSKKYVPDEEKSSKKGGKKDD